MRAQDSRLAGVSARPDGAQPAAKSHDPVEADFAHLCACWPRNHVRTTSRTIAEWCGWSLLETRLKLARMRAARLIRAFDRHRSHLGATLVFWLKPVADALPLVDDPKLISIGITRAVRDDEAKVVTYNGLPVAEVERLLALNGWSLGGYELRWLGGEPSTKELMETIS